jgi:glyoxylase-like metal-dependent hydrolase (beta-lactamase superfamily II)
MSSEHMPDGPMSRIELPRYDVAGIRACNPGPFTLSGTNSWIVGRNPAWVIDPGPAIDEHLEALAQEIEARGGLGGIALTHDHPDHAEAVPPLRGRFPNATLAAARGEPTVLLRDDSTAGSLTALSTPGHALDHFAFALGRPGLGELVFSGDAVLGEGSVFITPYPGALAAYLDGLARLRERDIALIAPGHGPVIEDPAAKLDQYVTHRLERERRLLAALDAGRRTVDELLDDAWSDAPAALRPAAAATLAAHLDKLEGEGRLPHGVERPRFSL